MKKSLLLSFSLLLFLSLALPSYAVNSVPKPVNKEEAAKKEVKDAKADWDKLSRKEKRAKKKEMRKDLKKAMKKQKAAGDSDISMLLLIIIAILIPPLAMALYDGISTRFWISLLLTLLFYVPGLIYTLVVILGGN